MYLSIGVKAPLIRYPRLIVFLSALYLFHRCYPSFVWSIFSSLDRCRLYITELWPFGRSNRTKQQIDENRSEMKMKTLRQILKRNQRKVESQASYILHLLQELDNLSLSKSTVETALLKRINDLEKELDLRDFELNELLNMQRNLSQSSDSTLSESGDDSWLLDNVRDVPLTIRTPLTCCEENSIVLNGDFDEDYSLDASQAVSHFNTSIDEYAHQSPSSQLSYRINQYLVSKVSPNTLITEIDQFLFSFWSTCSSPMTLVADPSFSNSPISIILTSFLKHMAKHQILGNTVKMNDFWEVYSSVIDKYTGEEDEEEMGIELILTWQSFMLDQTEWIGEKALRSLLSMYKYDLVDDEMILDWYEKLLTGENPYHASSDEPRHMKNLITSIQPFIQWLRTQVSEDEDGEESEDEQLILCDDDDDDEEEVICSEGLLIEREKIVVTMDQIIPAHMRQHKSFSDPVDSTHTFMNEPVDETIQVNSDSLDDGERRHVQFLDMVI